LVGRRNFSTIGKSSQTNKEPDTVIYPITQFSPLLRPNISTEVPTIRLLLYHLSTTLSAAIWLFTSGYFNPTPRLISLLINTHSSGAVLTASPQANGFFNSRGLSGFLPAAYTLLSLRFLQAVGLAGKSPKIGMREWRKGTASEPGGWTYHAKGLWVTTDRECLTVVGSSNYTKRSEELDLEVGVLIATRNEELRRRMGEEQRWLLENGKVVTEEDLKAGERGGGWLVVFLVWVVGLFGMSL
jgi:CDP-diacylglycerol---glycerol-3-phosphate 3-phosphatidyltransferase